MELLGLDASVSGRLTCAQGDDPQVLGEKTQLCVEENWECAFCAGDSQSKIPTHAVCYGILIACTFQDWYPGECLRIQTFLAILHDGVIIDLYV